MLAVDVPLATEHDRTLVAAAFLEIVRQMWDADLLRDFFTDGVDLYSILVGLIESVVVK